MVWKTNFEPEVTVAVREVKLIEGCGPEAWGGDCQALGLHLGRVPQGHRCLLWAKVPAPHPTPWEGNY